MTDAYGFDLDADLHRRLRGDPPAAALRWVEEQLGVRVLDTRALDGGMSAAVHRLSVRTPAGSPFEVVMRRYVLDWVTEEPDVPYNEERVLRRLDGIAGVPAPRLLAADPAGRATGTPTTVMSALPGTVVWHPADRELWLRRLAELVPVIHAVPPTPELTDWAIYPPEPGQVPPRWSKYPWAWEQALTQYQRPCPPSDRVFVHRDFHPGNVLWTGTTITGVVDWVSSCVGPAEEDVAHCRVNLAWHFGLPAADRFLALWQEISGTSGYDPYWDLVNVLSMAPDEPVAALDEFVAAAAARIG